MNFLLTFLPSLIESRYQELTSGQSRNKQRTGTRRHSSGLKLPSSVNVIRESNKGSATASKKYLIKEPTMPPRDSSANTAGFVHIGKTGGSTISVMLRNGCSSFVKSPCRQVEHESAISKLVEHYYHVSDFFRLPTSNHRIFILSVRDVYDRTVSAYLYHHPRNYEAFNLTHLSERQQYLAETGYKCFPTLQRFSSLLVQGDDPDACNYNHRFNEVWNDDCPALACAVIHGKVRFFSHLFFNYRNILWTKLPNLTDAQHSRTLYAIRQERFWDDWSNVNQLLGQSDPVYIPKADAAIIQRNVSKIQAPVTKDIDIIGREKLCRALETEYRAYFEILRRSVNIDETDMAACIQKAKANCPVLDIQTLAKG